MGGDGLRSSLSDDRWDGDGGLTGRCWRFAVDTPRTLFT